MSSPDLHTEKDVINLAEYRNHEGAPEIPIEAYDGMLDMLEAAGTAIEEGEVGGLVIAAVSPDGESYDYSFMIDLTKPNTVTDTLRSIGDELHDMFRDHAVHQKKEQK